MTDHMVTLNNGVKMPLLGLGVYKASSAPEMANAVSYALKAGYRSFDTAQMYHNEALLGDALQQAGISRSDYFLTSKVDNANQGYASTLRTFQESLQKLKTDYLDLFLVHWPGQRKKRLCETWRAMEELYQSGQVRAIGVCNSLPRHITWILENGHVPPAVNQIERQPLNSQNETTAWCQQHDIQVEAWAPLMRGAFQMPPILALSEKHQKTPAQILLRWNVQRGVIVIPKSVHRERIAENAAVFDFSLSDEDLKLLDALDAGKHTSFDPETFDFD